MAPYNYCSVPPSVPGPPVSGLALLLFAQHLTTLVNYSLFVVYLLEQGVFVLVCSLCFVQ